MKDKGLYQRRSPPALLLLKGKVTKHTTVKWIIVSSVRVLLTNCHVGETNQHTSRRIVIREHLKKGQ